MNTVLRTCTTLATALTLAGCAAIQEGVVVSKHESGERWLDSNYYTIEYPFTDDGAAKARSKADQLCGREKMLAVQAERACTLERCTTHYQCVTPKDAKNYGL
ncbi:MAG: hypothetical protein QG584_144 [Pseudomonadota bacterium]|jgi:hypothetical protein|nr:hypothetical protein [Pseudomonadota bacterium]MDQ5904082.1 hypothetical protein [Pseudomonadota bacterium]MDQ5906474.1 hypothetical protein [Pseudomonadota bacterium]MDQ5914262.1 hypothetical protein [Pseudomonadota bacterium]MDQ5946333.1 hypothetical protein [Pseudomonadota bacterium]